MRSLAAISGLGVLALVAGLGPLSCAKYPNCKKNADCKAEVGEVCVDKTCQNCTTDADCVVHTPPGEAPYICNALRCSPAGAVGAAGAGQGEEGSPCTGAEQCVGGLTCRAGVCALCNDDIECPSGTCNLDSGRCGPAGPCMTDDACAMDEICDGGMCVFSGDLGEEGGGPCGLAAIYFAFDSDELTPQAQDELNSVAECITGQATEVYLEAHADDRGTEEYNILLTERRGIMVRKFLVDRGVPTERMKVIAKGSLEATGSDESSRSKDRRVAFIWP